MLCDQLRSTQKLNHAPTDRLPPAVPLSFSPPFPHSSDIDLGHESAKAVTVLTASGVLTAYYKLG